MPRSPCRGMLPLLFLTPPHPRLHCRWGDMSSLAKVVPEQVKKYYNIQK